MRRWPHDLPDIALWFLRPIRSLGQGPVLVGRRIVVRPGVLDDFPQWMTLRRDSRDFLEPWEPSWYDDELTRASFRRRIKIYQQWAARDHGHALFIFEKGSKKLLGAISISNIRRGAELSATLGYWIGLPFVRQGYMAEAMQLVLDHAFDTMGLHRVEAACLPRNEASKSLLLKMGFAQEGYAKSYIKIAGHWEDHLLFARLKTMN